MAQPREKLLDLRLGGEVAFGGRVCIGDFHQPRLRIPDIEKQHDRVERLELRRERVFCRIGNGRMPVFAAVVFDDSTVDAPAAVTRSELEIVVGDIVIWAGADANEGQLTRAIRAARAAAS